MCLSFYLLLVFAVLVRRDKGTYESSPTQNIWILPDVLSCLFSSQIGLAIAIRYSLSRRAFSVTPNGPEVLLLDYPSHQRRLLPLLAKT